MLRGKRLGRCTTEEEAREKIRQAERLRKQAEAKEAADVVIPRTAEGVAFLTDKNGEKILVDDDIYMQFRKNPIYYRGDGYRSSWTSHCICSSARVSPNTSVLTISTATDWMLGAPTCAVLLTPSTTATKSLRVPRATSVLFLIPTTQANSSRRHRLKGQSTCSLHSTL